MRTEQLCRDGQPREHHFYVATAKCAYLHPRRGIVFVRDPIASNAAARYGLSPLILYGLAVPGTAIHFICYSATTSPLSLLGMLQNAWKTAPGLRGCPEILRVSRHLANAAPELAANLERLGVRMAIADGRDKRFPASLRNGQNLAVEIGWGLYGQARNIDSIDALNNVAMAFHHQRASRDRPYYWSTKNAVTEHTLNWLALPEMTATAELPAHLDWKIGPWLSAWEANLPPDYPRTIDASQGVLWLMKEEGHGAEEIDDGSTDFAAEKAKLIADCWPNELLAIAKAVGITAKELRWYLTGKASLDGSTRSKLLSMLGVEYLEEYDDYEARGPSVLIANATRTISAAYNELSGGGDLEFSFEAIPDRGAADPSWRYLVFRSCARLTCVIMIPRGGPVAEALNDRTFINFEGQKTLPAAIYWDIVAACGRGCADPSANIPQMMEFERRNGEYLDDFARY